MRARTIAFSQLGATMPVLAYLDDQGKVRQVKPLYVRRQVTNAKDIIKWAKGQGFATTLPAEDMHVTIAFSKKPVDWGAAGASTPSLSVWDTSRRSVEPLGEQGAVVLKFESDDLTKRWKQFCGVGASWDFVDYHPHITISYATPAALDLRRVAPYDGAIDLGPEIFEPVDENWADNIKEHAQKGHVCDYKQVAADLDALEARALKDARAVLSELESSIKAKVERAYPDGLRALVKGFAFSLRQRRDLRTGLQEALRRAWERGGKDMRAEVREGKAGTREYADWDESKHSRVPKGSGDPSGEFAPTDGSDGRTPTYRGSDGALVVKVPATGSFAERRGVSVGSKVSYRGTSMSREPFSGSGTVVGFVPNRSGYSGSGRGKPSQDVVIHDKRNGRFQFVEDVNVRLSRSRFEQHDYAGADSSFAPVDALRWLTDKAFWVSGVLSDKLLGDLKGALLNGIKTGKPLGEIISDLADVFLPYLGNEDMVSEAGVVQAEAYRLATIIRTNTTEAYNHGRLSQIKGMLSFLNGVRYSAILDERTTEVCRFLDGKVFLPDSDDLESLLPPNHFNCRSIVVPVVVGEKVNAEDFITDAEIGRARMLADAKFLSLREEENKQKVT